MRTLIKLLMLLLTLAFVGLNALSFMASSKVVQQRTAENDPALTRRLMGASDRLKGMVADRALEERNNSDTFVREWASKETGKPDADANALQSELSELARKTVEQNMNTAGAVTAAGILSGGILCVSTAVYGVAMLVRRQRRRKG